MKRLFILACVLIVQVTNNLSAQCNRPNPSDNPCNASTFCNTAQLDAFCSAVPTPVSNRVFIKPNGFCGSLESPSWFKFVAESTTLSLRFTANACGVDGVQAVILSTTNCSDSASYSAVSNCSNATGGQPISTVTANGLVAGRTYYILVDGFQGAGCSYAVDVISGTIKATTTPLPAPATIFGPTTVCTNATNVTFSVPKAPNVTDYHFVVKNTTTNTTLFDGVQTDSFYTVSGFPATGTLRICVSYKNDCTEGTTFCSDVTVNTTVNVNLPNVYLCPGSFYTLPDGLVVDNTIPPVTDQTQGFTAQKTGTASCDTTFNVNIVSYALREGSRSVFLKLGETVAVCNTTYTGVFACGRRDRVATCAGAAANGCDSIVNTALFNAKITHSITPANPILNCNSVLLKAAHADTCTETMHGKTYQWFYQTAANAPLSNLNNTTTQQNAATAGIYVLVVKDSVYSKTATFTGYRVYTDTIRNTVTGNGSSGALATPSLIGQATITLCQGARTTFKINSVPNATSYTWSFAKNGGAIIGTTTDTSIVVQWANNTSGDTIYVKAKGLCDSSAAQKITVLFTNFANLDAGPDRIVCTLKTTLAGVSSTGTGSWATVSAVGANFANNTSPTTSVTAPSAGVYKFAWTETLNGCTKSDTVQITFGTPPQYSGFKDSCSLNRLTYFVKFNILGGTPPLSVVNVATGLSAGTVNAAGAFLSNPLPTGAYNLQIKDGNNCISALIPVAQTCTACFTRAGQMDTTTAFSICDGDTARATYLGGYISDGNDTLQFVLHKGNPQTGIVARSYSPKFGFNPLTMTYETPYYISPIAGDDSTRQVKLNDICFNSGTGVLVIFHKKPTAAITLDAANLCVGSCTNLRYTFTGAPPFTITTRITDIGSRDTTISGTRPSYVLQICPTINTAYRLFAVADSNGCSTTGLVQTVNVKTFIPLDAGTPRAPLSICSGVDTTVNLLTQLIGALQGGTWTETSTIQSTGTAFNAVAGSFRTRGQIAGTYRFSYVVKQVVGSPCPADTANVTLILSPAPLANAGPDDTLTCDKTKID